jgi:hypothetical protein
MAPRDCLNQIFSQHAFLFTTARHTADAGFDAQIVGINCLHLISSLSRFFSHDVKHLRNQAFLPWASVYDQYVHRYNICSIILD